MVAEFTIRWKRPRRAQALPELDNFPATPAVPIGDVGRIEPSFVTRWSRARRIVALPVAHEYPETPIGLTAEGYPSWKKVEAHRVSSRIKLQVLSELNEFPPLVNVGPETILRFIPRIVHKKSLIREAQLVEFPATPDPPTAQEFPSWQLVESNKFSLDFKLQTLKLSQYIAEPVSTAWKAVKTNKFNFSIDLQTLELNEYPATPPALTAEGFPAWQAIQSNKFKLEFKLQKVELNEYPAIAFTSPYPSWREIATNKSSFNIKLKQVEELNVYPLPSGAIGATGSLVPHFSTRSVSRKKLLRLPELPSSPAISLTAEDYPSWKKIEINRINFDFTVHTTGLDEYPVLSVLTAQEYPSWLEPKKFSVWFEIGRVPHYGQNSLLTAALYPSHPFPRAFKISFKRKLLTLPELNEYTPTPLTSEEFPAWKAVESNTFGLTFKLQTTEEINRYPVLTAEGFPAWKAVESNKVEFNFLLQKVELNEYSTLTAEEFPAWKLVESNKFGLNYKLQKIELNEYPVLTAEEYPAWKQVDSNKFGINFQLQESLELNEYPIAPYSSWLRPEAYRTKFQFNHQTIQKLNEYPAIPPVNDWPAFQAPKILKINFEHKLLQLPELNEYTPTPLTAQDFPAFKVPPVFYRPGKRKFLEVEELNEYPPLFTGWKEQCPDDSVWVEQLDASDSWTEATKDDTVWTEESSDPIPIERCD